MGDDCRMRRISIAFSFLVVGYAHAAFAQTVVAKPKPKPAPATTKAVHGPPGVADPSVRQKVAGGPTTADVATGVESAELKALREAEREFFPPALPQSSPWPSELPAPMAREDG